VQIGALRRVFGEEPGDENWIETLPRRGYRFIGPASIQDQGAVIAASQKGGRGSNPASGTERGCWLLADFVAKVPKYPATIFSKETKLNYACCLIWHPGRYGSRL
jgi:hypothetical protein